MADKQKDLNKAASLRADSTEAKVESFVTTLRAFLLRALEPILDDLKAAKLPAKEAAKALGGLEAAVAEAGLGGHFDAIRELFTEQYSLVQDEFKATTGKTALLNSFTRDSLDALIDERLNLAASFVTDYLGDVRSAVLDSVILGQPFKPVELLTTAEGGTFSKLKTEVDTTLMAYQRIVHLEKAKKAGIEKFLYVGPEDDITRQFCLEHVDKIYTREQIDAMDNGTDLPVAIYCGGYNCRHHWRPVSDALAAEIEAEQQGTSASPPT